MQEMEAKKKRKKVHYHYINLLRFLKAIVHTSLIGEICFCIESGFFPFIFNFCTFADELIVTCNSRRHKKRSCFQALQINVSWKNDFVIIEIFPFSSYDKFLTIFFVDCHCLPCFYFLTFSLPGVFS